MKVHARLALLALGLGGLALSCGDDSPPAGACGQLESLLRTCDILSQGPFACTEPADDEEECILRCLNESTCGGLRRFFCDNAGPAFDCADQCPIGPRFDCDDGSQIPASFECDGQVDCPDGSDETCTNPPTFTCDNGATVSQGVTCDGVADCADLSDEVSCPAVYKCDG